MENQIQEQVKPRRRISLWIFLIMLIVGIILTVIGGYWLYSTGMSIKYNVESFDKEFDGSEITRLDLDLGVGQIYIKPSPDEKIYVKAENVPENYYTFSTSGNEFKANCEKIYLKNFMKIGLINTYDEDSGLTILLPEKLYENVIIDSGVGELYISGLSCKNADINQGVGECDYDNFTVTEIIDFDCGVGETDIINSSFAKANVDCGVGEFKFSGKLLGDLDADCGVGEVSFDIDGYYDDYEISNDDDFKLDIDKGSNHSQSSGTKYKINIDSGIGEAKLSFK